MSNGLIVVFAVSLVRMEAKMSNRECNADCKLVGAPVDERLFVIELFRGREKWCTWPDWEIGFCD